MYFFVFISVMSLVSCVSTGNVRGSISDTKETSVNNSLAQEVNFSKIKIDVALSGKEILENIDYLKSQGLSAQSIFDSYNYFQEVPYENGTLLIVWAYNDFFVGKDFLRWKHLDIAGVSYLVKYYWKDTNGVYQEPTANKWFSVAGKATAVTLSTNTPKKMTTHNDTSFGINDEGISSLVVSFLGKNMSLDFNVFVIPITPGFGGKSEQVSKTDDIITLYGLPDSKTPYAIAWPNEKIVNGFIYFPKPGLPESGEHWRFRKYPDLVFDIIPTNGYIKGITTYRDKELYSKWKTN